MVLIVRKVGMIPSMLNKIPEEGALPHQNMYIHAPIISGIKQPVHSSSCVGFGVKVSLLFLNKMM